MQRLLWAILERKCRGVRGTLERQEGEEVFVGNLQNRRRGIVGRGEVLWAVCKVRRGIVGNFTEMEKKRLLWAVYKRWKEQ